MTPLGLSLLQTKKDVNDKYYYYYLKNKKKRKSLSKLSHNKTQTEVLYGEDVTNLILQIVYHAKERVNTCDNSQMPSAAIAVEPFRKAIVDAKGRGVRLR